TPAPVGRGRRGHGDGAGAAGRAPWDGRPPGQRTAAAGRLIRGESAAGPDILRCLGAIAQLGERRAGSAKVTGSSPVSSITVAPWGAASAASAAAGAGGS